ncbi:hypothetical protein GCM10022419_039260 [Nonomuraea rosea]|uniref:Uncharacterized protein n=1 Tax=Nonomuraea rosea TaxID=638574 RepID=A0ABP6WSR9_9ACTN
MPMIRRNAAHWAKTCTAAGPRPARWAKTRPLGQDPPAGPRPAQPLAASWRPSGFAGTLATAPTVAQLRHRPAKVATATPAAQGGLQSGTRAACGVWAAASDINKVATATSAARRPAARHAGGLGARAAASVVNWVLWLIVSGDRRAIMARVAASRRRSRVTTLDRRW